MKKPRNMVDVEDLLTWTRLGLITEPPLPRRVREGLVPGDFAKIRVSIKRDGRVVGSESFWVRIDTKSTVPVSYAGAIDNDLVHTKHHGLKADDAVRFGPENVLAVQKPS